MRSKLGQMVSSEGLKENDVQLAQESQEGAVQ
jgi:hypothetical protein